MTWLSDKSLKTLKEFLEMPIESTDPVFSRFGNEPGTVIRGEGLRKFVYVPGRRRKDRVLLVAHADTVWDSEYTGETRLERRLACENGVIWNIHGGLGADDRAGCAMIWELRHLGHSILITNGEEQGRVGATWLMDENPDIADEINSTHQFMVQLDRRNGSDFKCYSVGSAPFRRHVEKMTGFSEPDRRVFTDIVALCRDVCGVNLSIGYSGEHTDNERLHIAHWNQTLKVCQAWLGQDRLPRFALRKAMSNPRPLAGARRGKGRPSRSSPQGGEGAMGLVRDGCITEA